MLFTLCTECKIRRAHSQPWQPISIFTLYSECKISRCHGQPWQPIKSFRRIPNSSSSRYNLPSDFTVNTDNPNLHIVGSRNARGWLYHVKEGIAWLGTLPSFLPSFSLECWWSLCVTQQQQQQHSSFYPPPKSHVNGSVKVTIRLCEVIV